MPSLAQVLQQTAPVSLLARKASRLGLKTPDDLITLAVNRGCRHHAPRKTLPVDDPGRSSLPDEELAVLLLSGSQEYEPAAIRCSAQIISGAGIDPKRLAFLARKERTERPLAHIARAGLEHDPDAKFFWEALLGTLGPVANKPEPHLPHWSRFVSMPGYQRGGSTARTTWLTPDP